MQSKLDIIIIILFVITVSVIIGLSIVNMIDKKISNISVNIPPLKVPKQTVVVKFGENHIQCNTNDNAPIPEHQTIQKTQKEGFEDIIINKEDTVDYDSKPKHEDIIVKGVVGSKDPPKKYMKCGTSKQPTKNYPRARIGPYKLKAANYDSYDRFTTPYKINMAIVPHKDLELKPTIPKPSNYTNELTR